MGRTVLRRARAAGRAMHTKEAGGRGTQGRRDDYERYSTAVMYDETRGRKRLQVSRVSHTPMP